MTKPRPTDPDRQARHLDAEARVARALQLIERAQHDIERACQELSPIEGAGAIWTRAGRVRDQVHSLWRRLAYRNRARWVVSLFYGSNKP